jgi:hypothetical protein
MSFIPKIKQCPCCDALNIMRVNGITYNNSFKSLTNWTLKKIFSCRNCKEKIGFFINKFSKNEKMVWFDFLKCDDLYYDELNKLQIKKSRTSHESERYNKILKEIQDIQNNIHLNKIKLKIKIKIKKNNRLLIGQVY